MDRYKQLPGLIEHYKPKTIIEVGTWKGVRACEMTAEAIKHQDAVVYYGFDLFEDATDDTDAEELNVKSRHSRDDVYDAILQALSTNPKNDDITVNLIRGNTRKTLPGFVRSVGDLPRPVFVFVDGGHSTKTIRSDYQALSKLEPEFIVFDDYYIEDADKKCPDRRKFGCNRLIDKLRKDGSKAWFLGQVDPVKDGGGVRMALLADNEPPNVNTNSEVRIVTKNAVSDEQLQANLEYSLASGYPSIDECKGHKYTAVMLSAGPSLDKQREKIEALNELDDHLLVCVKNSHDKIINDWGIIPWGCVLLDPRPHVQEFIQNPHPDVKYFTATQVDRTTIDQLMKHNANVYLYNAVVGWDGEMDYYAEHGLMGIAGGSTAATRGLYVMRGLGFLTFKLFGYDSCFDKKPPKKLFADERNAKRAMAMKVNGKKFYTTSELMAQAQDFQHFVASGTDFRLYGDGMIQYLYNPGIAGKRMFAP